ncbi:arginine repressor [Vagococcus lutrae]|uniref:Arginine repressor n=1 Tax=Vagococcus lutrae TaxID=81947 RepID=A0AAE9XE89_9ENTE|nr:arginine repressor [Vagococcus lutrae]MDO5742523.1 arginine repressor [Vagococcus sp.]MCO7151144.1 arginine repressor [Vagococcus lutrae]MDT2811383.1 arginine repressor [Vagococcus lutrae]MDT2817047.1 arginine repressor [Vagococcus lutrae]MDT2819577.1 arginine repressor [Vagococcus lutrae]
MNKKQRQDLIIDIISNHVIRTQQELMEALHLRDVQVTQATLSRDISELGLVKEHGAEGEVKYGLYQEPKKTAKEIGTEKMVLQQVTDIKQVEFTLIIHTKLGSADMVAALLDEKNYPEVAGTLAGKDTLVIIAIDKAAATRLKNHILKELD